LGSSYVTTRPRLQRNDLSTGSVLDSPGANHIMIEAAVVTAMWKDDATTL